MLLLGSNLYSSKHKHYLGKMLLLRGTLAQSLKFRDIVTTVALTSLVSTSRAG